jgi:hypothetical protein
MEVWAIVLLSVGLCVAFPLLCCGAFFIYSAQKNWGDYAGYGAPLYLAAMVALGVCLGIVTGLAVGLGLGLSQ